MNRSSLGKRKLMAIVMVIAWAVLLIQGSMALFSLYSRYQFLHVISGSMEPALHTGSIVAVHKSTGTLFSPGDIITFQEDDLLITHRIKEVGYNGSSFYYLTQGDANQQPDLAFVKHQQVVGQVVFTTPAFLSRILGLFTVRYLLLFHALLFIFLGRKKMNKGRRLATHA
ncbi:MAG: signal peptidase I [Firmicutes bacterium]|nr:signal peptidase I [Bacillota bacterium]